MPPLRCTLGAASGRWPPRTHRPPGASGPVAVAGTLGATPGRARVGPAVPQRPDLRPASVRAARSRSTVGKLITQGSLPLAIVVALTVNRRVIVRPNVFLCLLSLLVVEAIVTSLQAQYVRGHGVPDLPARRVRCRAVAADALLGPARPAARPLPSEGDVGGAGLGGPGPAGVPGAGHGLAAGSAARSGPIPATQVAHYAAVTLGLVVVLWLCDRRNGRVTLLVVAATGVILLLTQTRTALSAMIAGILIAGLSLIVAKARVRKLFAGASSRGDGRDPDAVGIHHHLAGARSGHGAVDQPQRPDQLLGSDSCLPRGTGSRRSSVSACPTTRSAACPSTATGSPPISTQGLFGVVVCATILLFLLVTAYFQPRGRAARSRPVPRDLLPGGVVHRDRVHRCLDLHARPHRGRVDARAGRRGLEAGSRLNPHS